MCVAKETELKSYADTDSGNCSGQSDSAAHLPDDVFKPKPGLVETYIHGKKVGNYLIGKELGSGSFAQVREGLHTLTGERVAIKIVGKETAKSDPYVAKNMRREGRILQLIRHANVVQLLEVMETEHSYYLVQELCHGGDFMAFLTKRRRLTEFETRRFVRQIVQAVDHMHSLGILHRDLKIENLLLTQDQNVKIIDFGLSNLVSAVTKEKGGIVTQLCRTQCGSPAYAAPEVLAKKTYGSAVDVWSIGVNMFAMLSGNLPFVVKPFSIKALYQKMVNQEINPLPKTLSASCRDLLLRLLNPQPETRIRLKDVMAHPWLNESVSTLRPSPFPNLLHRADLREDVLRQVSQRLYLPIDDVARKVLDNNPSPSLSTYLLMSVMADRYARERPSASKAPSPADSPSEDNSEKKLPDDAAAEDEPEKLQLATKSSQNSTNSNKEELKHPMATGLPRRERTFCGAVPVSAIATERTQLVRLEKTASTENSRSGGAMQTTVRSVLLPQCARNAATGSQKAATQRTTAAPIQRFRSDSNSVGRSSIQSLVCQRYPAVANSRATGLFSRPRTSGFSALSSAASATAAATAAAALAAASTRPSQVGGSIGTRRIDGSLTSRFSSAACATLRR